MEPLLSLFGAARPRVLLVVFAVALAAALAGTGVAATRDDGTAEARQSSDIESEEAADEASSVETATMSIPVEQGDVIDLRTPTDVKIETWDGDEVLLIVEKVKRDGKEPAVDPVIRVTRNESGVHIETTGPAWRQYGNRVSFRLVLPDDGRPPPPPTGSLDDIGSLSRWTLRVLRVVHREALRRLL